jgi:hypothetical protein
MSVNALYLDSVRSKTSSDSEPEVLLFSSAAAAAREELKSLAKSSTSLETTRFRPSGLCFLDCARAGRRYLRGITRLGESAKCGRTCVRCLRRHTCWLSHDA